MRSFVTPVIRATLPSSAVPRTTTPEPSLLAQGIDQLAQAFAVHAVDFGGEDADAFDVSGAVEQGSSSLRAGGLALSGFQLLFELL